MRLNLVLATLLLALPAAAEKEAAPPSAMFLKKKSAHSVVQTIDKLEKVLKSKGITIFARVDHAAGAKKAGLELKPTLLLIFGNPKLGTPLMQTNRLMGLELPMKALAYEDDQGDVWLVVLKPEALKQRHRIQGRDKVFGKMKGALAKFTDIATK